MPHNSLGVPPYSLAYFFLSCTAYKDLIYSVGLGQSENLLAFAIVFNESIEESLNA